MIASGYEKERKYYQWRTYGKKNLSDVDPDNPETKTISFEEISDSHLLHIIGNVMTHRRHFGEEMLNRVLMEAEYRSVNNIFIPDYKDTQINIIKK